MLHPCEEASGEGGKEERKREIKDRKKEKQQSLMWVYSETRLHFRERVGGFEQTHHKKEKAMILRQRGEKQWHDGKKQSDSRGKPPTEMNI